MTAPATTPSAAPAPKASALSCAGESAKPTTLRHIYWANRVEGANTNAATSIGRANLDGTGVNQRFIPGANSGDGVAIAGDYIYWGNSEDTMVGRAKLDGTQVNQHFISGTSAVGIPATDGTYLYWGNITIGAIGRAKLDGTEVNQRFISWTGEVPVFVAISGGCIYWSQLWANRIGRARLDGTGADVSYMTLGKALSDIDIGVVPSPAGIAITGSYIYWASVVYSFENKIKTGGAIGRAKLDGSDINRTFIRGDFNPVGIAVGGNYIYWTNIAAGTIGRAKVDGTGVNQSFITGGSMPTGVTVGP